MSLQVLNFSSCSTRLGVKLGVKPFWERLFYFHQIISHTFHINKLC